MSERTPDLLFSCYSVSLFFFSLYNFNLMENKHITCFRNEPSYFLNEIEYVFLFSLFRAVPHSHTLLSLCERCFTFCIFVSIHTSMCVNKLSVAVLIFRRKFPTKQKKNNKTKEIVSLVFCAKWLLKLSFHLE